MNHKFQIRYKIFKFLKLMKMPKLITNIYESSVIESSPIYYYDGPVGRWHSRNITLKHYADDIVFCSESS